MTCNCRWHIETASLTEYHDLIWGRPCVEDTDLFMKISLESLQAGLSWRTILEKKPIICKLFVDFDIPTIASFDAHRIETIIKNPEMIRHRKKIAAICQNANTAMQLQSQHGSLREFFWSFRPNPKLSPFDEPPKEAVSLTAALKHHGWKFIGVTTCYAFMQAAGIINDHDLNCPIRSLIPQPYFLQKK